MRDSFAEDSLPPKELWPEIINVPDYPEELNCAAEILDKAVQSGFGDKVAIYSAKETLTYRELLFCTNQIANFLVNELSLRAGNRVLIHGPNTPKFVALWFAVLKAGGICVATMPLLRAKELNYIIEKANVSHILCDDSVAGELNNPTLFSSITYESGEFNNVKTKATDVAIIAFTSGTTGKAKATAHFHRDILTICDHFPVSILKANSSDIFCGTPPLAFTFGLGGLVLFPFRIGASTVLLERPTDLLGAISDFKVTTLFTSPTGYRSMINQLPETNSLKTCVSAGENLPLSTFNQWKEKTGLSIIDGIGATEMLHIFISASGSEVRAGSTGKVVPGYEACILDSEGKLVPDGEVGLLAVKGPTGCRYLNDEDRQKQYARFGWNYTGDAYIRDKDGYFWFQARADDMIISGGYNISANEVENALLSHPSVKECGVIGVPDDLRGNIVKAFVVLNDKKTTALELQEFVKQEIAPYKYPRAIEFVETLPRTETGKLQRFKLRD